MTLRLSKKVITTTEPLLKAIVEGRIRDAELEIVNEGTTELTGFPGSKYCKDLTILNYKGKTLEGKEKILEEFLAKEDLEKLCGVIKSVAWDEDGYLAYKIGLDTLDASEDKAGGKVTLEEPNMNSLMGPEMEFKNITEFKNWLKKQNQHVLLKYYGYHVRNKNDNLIGRIGIIDHRRYKTMPKRVPAKYTSVEKLYKIVVYTAYQPWNEER